MAQKTKRSVLFFGKKKDSQCEALYEFLCNHFSEVTVCWSSGYGARVNEGIAKWQGDYIFCYRSHYILSVELIKQAKYAAINFHPGPPEYRGVGCVNWALYEQVITYGCTAHLMSEIVDGGTILNVRRIKVLAEDGIEEVLSKTYEQMYVQAVNVISRLRNEPHHALKEMEESCERERWSDKLYTKRELEALYEVPLDISSERLRQIIRATVFGSWGPVVNVGGRKFQLQDTAL